MKKKKTHARRTSSRKRTAGERCSASASSALDVFIRNDIEGYKATHHGRIDGRFSRQSPTHIEYLLALVEGLLCNWFPWHDPETAIYSAQDRAMRLLAAIWREGVLDVPMGGALADFMRAKGYLPNKADMTSPPKLD